MGFTQTSEQDSSMNSQKNEKARTFNKFNNDLSPVLTQYNLFYLQMFNEHNI